MALLTHRLHGGGQNTTYSMTLCKDDMIWIWLESQHLLLELLGPRTHFPFDMDHFHVSCFIYNHHRWDPTHGNGVMS
jgi:hypothetical protein